MVMTVGTKSLLPGSRSVVEIKGVFVTLSFYWALFIISTGVSVSAGLGFIEQVAHSVKTLISGATG